MLMVAVVVCVWLVAARTALKADCKRLQADLTEHRSRADQCQDELRTLERERKEVDQKLAIAQQVQEQTQQQFDKAQKELRLAFDSLAGQALKASTDQFLTLARKTFEGEQKEGVLQLEHRKMAITKMLDPLKESLREYKQVLQAVEKERKQDKGKLSEQLHRLGQETSELARVLRHPGSRGQWGQMTLRRVVEMAGMNARCDFDEQVSVQTDQRGRFQPDMVVRLPNSRTVVIDAKTPFDAFYRALEAEGEEDRQALLQRHAQAIDHHAKQLAGKQYSQLFEHNVDFVVMFLPAESILHAAVQVSPGLIESAMNKKVIIATPSILMAVLRAVASGWQEQNLAQNAKKISELGKELHRRLAIVFEHHSKLGSALESTVTHFNSLGASLEARVLPQARKFAELGADSTKELPSNASHVENGPRPPIVVTKEAVQPESQAANI